jgi:hypothetical protein
MAPKALDRRLLTACRLRGARTSPAACMCEPVQYGDPTCPVAFLRPGNLALQLASTQRVPPMRPGGPSTSGSTRECARGERLSSAGHGSRHGAAVARRAAGWRWPRRCRSAPAQWRCRWERQWVDRRHERPAAGGDADTGAGSTDSRASNSWLRRPVAGSRPTPCSPASPKWWRSWSKCRPLEIAVELSAVSRSFGLDGAHSWAG